jgi:hypothetical protein
VARHKARTRSVIKPIHCFHDGAMDTVGICQDVLVPDAQHMKALRLQVRVAGLIGSRLPMLSAVCLYDEPRFQAREVNDVVVDWNLSAESKPSDLPLPQ